jgi:hypothetical protein
MRVVTVAMPIALALAAVAGRHAAGSPGPQAQPTEDAGDRLVAVVGVAGVAESFRTNAGEDTVLEAYGYAMPSGQEYFAWPLGSGEGDLTSGVGLLALPEIQKGASDSAASHRIGIANLAHRPGFTDFVMYIHDDTQLVDCVCQKLNEAQSEYIDLNRWGYVNPGFRGSSFISASFWEHDVFDFEGKWLRNTVGLAAVADEWSRTPAEGRDAASAIVAVPIYVHNGVTAGPDRPALTCASNPGRPMPPPLTPVPTASPTPRPTSDAADAPAYSARAPQIHFPALGRVGDDSSCQYVLSFQNAGREPARAVALLWKVAGECGPSCAGPTEILCTGLIAPGWAWRVGFPVLTADVRSAVVYSFDPSALEAAAPPCASPATFPGEFVAFFGTVTESCAA